MQWFRVRLLLRITRPTPKLFPIQGPLIYALIAEAFGDAHQCPPRFPPGMIPHAPEQLRTRLGKGDEYALGLTLLVDNEDIAHEQLIALLGGLRRIGSRQVDKPRSLDGNFEIVRIDDLVAGMDWHPDRPLTPLSPDHVQSEIDQLANRNQVTLRFHTPLRTMLPRPLRKERHDYMRRGEFHPDYFIQRLRLRLIDLGFETGLGGQITNGHSSPTPHETFEQALPSVRLVDNQLVWVDGDYGGGKKKGLRLGGAVGRVVLGLPPDFPRHWLVWGQYTHVGEATKFGFGGYRIEELGSDPFAVARGCSLTELALREPLLQVACEKTQLVPARLSSAAEQLRLGSYRPPAPAMIWLETPGDKPRRLLIPGPIDRALQRAVAEALTPGLESLFETSSYAYRKGLSRHSAARQLERAWQRGSRWALKADFTSFFESVDHRELQARLEAYVSDDSLVATIMQWVTRSDPERDDLGLPTGAPISPLLANLFLDQFDEEIARLGGRLVRYADDFLILFKDQAAATRALDSARAAADRLRLTLNTEKTALLDLREPFEFLGFRFAMHGSWEIVGQQNVQHLDQLGWIDLGKVRPPYQPKVMLNGELELAPPDLSECCIVDTQPLALRLEGGRLIVDRPLGQVTIGPDLDRIHQLWVVGRPDISGALIQELSDRGIPWLMTDEDGMPTFEASPEDRSNAELLTAQVLVRYNTERRLRYARPLIAAKLINYAAVADAYPPRKGADDVGPALRALAQKARNSKSIDELLGIEGAGGARWYQSFGSRLPPKFSFRRRVAPNASDPVNVMLNIAHTHLYRQVLLACRLMGLTPLIGLLHEPRAGFAPLAADLQEPFRCLMDRAVIEVAYKLSPSAFKNTNEGQYALGISFAARRRLLGTIHATLGINVSGKDDPISYRRLLLRLARNVRHVLLNDGRDLEVPELPSPPGEFDDSQASLIPGSSNL